DLPARPGHAQRLVAGTPGHLGGRHSGNPACVPAQAPGADRAHTRSGRPLNRLSPTAIVALVVATSDSKEIGIGAPVRQASTKCASSAPWPLSWPPRDRVVLRRRPAQTMTDWKLSNLALRPPAAASNVSFGKRGLPPVTYVMVPLDPFWSR